MRGVIEIYANYEDRSPELILREENLIVDGASEVITDLMTMTSSVSGISSASSILDTSNFTMGAASFSKGVSGFLYNAHGNNGITVSGRTQFDPPRIYVVNQNSTSSYSPIASLPSYPDPQDRLLQLLPSSVSSLIVTYGQNLNLIPYWSSLSAVSSIGASGAFALGAFPTCATGTNRIMQAIYSPTSSFITSARMTSNTFNEFSSMDWRGFVTTTRGGTSFQGLLVSATLANSGLGQVRYQIKIGADDLAVANAYGGIYSIGLWTVDIKRSLLNSNPPFIFHPVTNPTEYKLFAKKVFNKNLGYIQDNGSSSGLAGYFNLTIDWTIYFI